MRGVRASKQASGQDRAGRAHGNVCSQQTLAVCLGQGDGIGDVGALRVMAEMAVAYSWIAIGVGI